MEITTKRMLISPSIAAKMLEHNTQNYRKISRRTVDAYASDMSAGRWKDNGETIVFDEDGVLKNGQHRLTAIVKSGVTLMMTVVSGVARDVNNYDQQSKRTAGQYLTAEGLSAALRLPYITGSVRSLLAGGFQIGITTNEQVKDYLLADAETWEMVGRLCDEKHNTYGKLCVSRTMPFAIAIYMAYKDGVIDADLRDFITVCNSGFPSKIHNSSSAIVLRNMLIKGREIYSREQKMLCFCATHQALRDFLGDINRTKPYVITNESAQAFKQFSIAYRNLYNKEK